MKLYVAGPMTGLPEFNFPAFHRAAVTLTDAGYVVENPAGNTLPPGTHATWVGYMRLALGQVLTCDGIALLDGWESSRGANLERHLAFDLEMPVRTVGEWLQCSPSTPNLHDVPLFDLETAP